MKLRRHHSTRPTAGISTFPRLPSTLRHSLAVVAGSALLAVTPLALAWQDELAQIQQRWETTTTSTPSSQREAALSGLVTEVEQLIQANPNVSDLLVWDGIIQASLAREKGGLGALDNAKAARRALERAIGLDSTGMDGSAYVTLGALYDRAPGWPVAFGDDDKAAEMFQRALSIRPDGIDVNYYYAAYLADEGRDAEAREYAQKAMQGTPRSGREASDRALQQQAQALINDL
ncbi:hypothetical protein [Halomonas huangheensis]|nr:hypothetical protein [Halomonas huangheensis]